VATIEEAIYTELTTAAAVIAIAGTRGYPELIPETAAMPAWAYQTISANREPIHSGSSDLTEQVIQITCQAASYASAKALAGAIRARLHGFKGTLSGVKVHRIVVDNDQDGLADEDGATVRLDVSVFYTES
jgi:hypothetical protein